VSRKLAAVGSPDDVGKAADWLSSEAKVGCRQRPRMAALACLDDGW
jgi:hypothetical protein